MSKNRKFIQSQIQTDKLMAAYERVVKRHGKTFEKLARIKNSKSNADEAFKNSVQNLMKKHNKTLRRLAGER